MHKIVMKISYYYLLKIKLEEINHHFNIIY